MTKVKKSRMNIVTSCDDNYVRYLFVNLANINLMLTSRYDIHFYLLQNSISQEHLDTLNCYADNLAFTFHNVQVNDVDWMSVFTAHSRCQDFARFFDGICHLLLPDDIDRVMYIDTGDFIFTSDDQSFYFTEFDNKSLLVSRYSSKVKSATDRYNFDFFSSDIWGTFNSGQVLFNLKRLRELDYKPQDYIDYINKWASAKPGVHPLFGGDQAFLSAFYAGDIETIEKQNPNNAKVSKKPISAIDDFFASVHFNEMFDSMIKPWHIPFNQPIDLEKYCLGFKNKGDKLLQNNTILNPVEVKYLLQWWDYCKLTPYYEDIKREHLTNPIFYERLMQRYSNIIKNSKMVQNDSSEKISLNTDQQIMRTEIVKMAEQNH